MRRSRRPAIAALLACLVALVLAMPTAWAAQDDDDEEEVGEELDEAPGDIDRLVVSTAQEWSTWNPFNQVYVIEHQFRQVHYESLVRNSAEDYGMVPGLAEDWSVSDDGLEWTFNLREDSVWHDGEPVTAQDVEYTFHIIQNDETIAAREADLVARIESAEATDDHTFVLTSNEPILLERLGTIIVPQHIWEEHDGAWSAWEPEPPLIGSGPYQLVEDSVRQFIRFEAHDDYWEGRPGFDEFVFRYYTEPDTAVAALEAGEVDVVTGLNDAQFNRLDGRDGITAVAAPNRRWVALRFNTGSVTRDGEEFGENNHALYDPVVRQAMHWAVDKEELVESVLAGFATPATSVVPQLFEGLGIWWQPSAEQAVTFDIDHANQILDDAGYEPGDDGVRVSPDGDRLSFTFGVEAEDAQRTHISEFLVQWWEQIGIEVEVAFDEDAVVHEKFRAGINDFTLTGWGINPDPTSHLVRETCGQLPASTETEDLQNNTNDAFFCDEEYDQLYEAQAQEVDPDARAEMLLRMQEILYEEAPMIFLYYPNVMEAYSSDKIASITAQPADGGMITGQLGPWAYHSAQPFTPEEADAAAAENGDSSGGVSTTAITIGAIALVVVAGLVIVLFRRRTAGERE